MITKILIAGSDFLIDYGVALLIFLVLLIIGIIRLLKIESVRFKYDSYLLRMPMIAKFSRGYNAAQVANTLSILTSSGVQLVDALRIAGEVTPNMAVRAAVTEAAVSLREGSSLNKSLDQSGYFPPMMIQMIASGESSGELDQMLERAARSQTRELDALITILTSLFEPLMMVVVGVVITGVILSVMMPMLSINNMIG